MKTLKSSMKEGGSLNALRACNLKASEIHGQVSLPNGVNIGRTSHKLRNPENAPKEWMKGIINEYVNGNKKGVTIVNLENGKGYLEPIYIKGMCFSVTECPRIIRLI